MWLFFIILAYFLLALASLIDRYLLAGPLPKPKVYAFFVNILGFLALLLLPFLPFPDLNQVLLSLLAGAVWTLAVFVLYLAIFKSEVSRVMPAIGALLPIFSLAISFLFLAKKIEISLNYLLALFLLILGGVLITLERRKKSISLKNLSLSALAALVFGLGFFLAKLVYLNQSFVSGFAWMRIGGALAALLFLFSSETRQAVFVQKTAAKKQALFPLILGQAFGGLGFILQSYSVSLAKIEEIALINALEGIRYVFLLLFISILGRKLPSLLKEKLAKRILGQKILATLIIVAGLALLALK